MFKKPQITDKPEGIKIQANEKSFNPFYKKLSIEYKEDETLIKNSFDFPSLEEFMNLENNERELIFKYLYSLVINKNIKSSFFIPSPYVFALSFINDNFKVINKNKDLTTVKHISKNLANWNRLLLTNKLDDKENKKFDEVLCISENIKQKDMMEALRNMDFKDSNETIHIYLETNALGAFWLAKALKTQNREFKLWMKYNNDWYQIIHITKDRIIFTEY